MILTTSRSTEAKIATNANRFATVSTGGRCPNERSLSDAGVATGSDTAAGHNRVEEGIDQIHTDLEELQALLDK
jgi:hypothetical protein